MPNSIILIKLADEEAKYTESAVSSVILSSALKNNNNKLEEEEDANDVNKNENQIIESN